jgi:hypothetical protein
MDAAKDLKIPFWEKLPADSQFTRHFLKKQYLDKVEGSTNEVITKDKSLLTGIRANIGGKKALPIKPAG